MMEPRRLFDEASGLDRAVLESALDDEPSPARRRRVLATVGGTSAAMFSSAAVARHLTSWKIASWKIVVGIAATTGIGIGGAVVHSQHASFSPVIVPTASAVASAAPVTPMAPVRPMAPVISAAPTPQAAPSTSSIVVTAPPPPAPARLVKKTADVPETALSIAREIALIDRARASIAKGDPKGVLGTLDEYDVECRRGALSLEAAILRIEALAATGDHDGAAARARKFLERHPQSAYDARVRAHVPNPRSERVSEANSS